MVNAWRGKRPGNANIFSFPANRDSKKRRVRAGDMGMEEMDEIKDG